MFNVSPLVLYNFFQTLAPFVYAFIKKMLRKISPFLDYCNFSWSTVVNFRQGKLFLVELSTWYNRLGSNQDCLVAISGQISMKVIFFWCKRLIVFLAVCDGAPSCCHVLVWYGDHISLEYHKQTLSEITVIFTVTVYFLSGINKYSNCFSHPRQSSRNHDISTVMFPFTYESALNL